MIKMKNSSIKKRVTLYYSLTLILITLLLTGVFLLTASRQATLVSKDTLMRAVQNSFDDIECKNDIIQIDNDFDAYTKGVTLLIYGEEGTLIKGSTPQDFPSHMPLQNGDYQELDSGEDIWLIYDLYNTYENGQGIWVRGIYAMDSTLQTLRTVIYITLIVLPLLLLVAILAGRRITNRAFEPVAEITAAANTISTGRDLSKRLPQGEAKDELYDLSETLNDMMERLENAFLAEKEFSSDVSHELKTPISVILAECEYTLQENRSTAEYKESLETIQKQCKRTMSLIQQLLQISRTINRADAIEPEHFDLSILCESIVSELSLMAEEEGVALQCDIAPEISIYADETLLMRMIINLITNSIKYRKDGADSYVKLTLRRGDRIVITVEDNGIGIKKEDLPNIFNRFYKVDKARTAEDGSFGLGLSMVKWIAETHGGSVSAESDFGRGSKFIVVL
ncbi:HAMP domain-containing sensor histidine kinase [Anaerovoracaceae bacterium 42-11]|nr:HAMP domain-containing histidine kinase [Emergencia sp.]